MQIAQPGINMGQGRQIQIVGGNGGNHFRQYVRQNVGNQNRYNALQNVRNQIRCYNCRVLGHLARNYTVRPKRRDNAYLQTQLLIAQKDEVGIQLQVEEFDLMDDVGDLDEIEEVNANCILIANLQQASTSGVDIVTKTKRLQPRSNTKNDRVLSVFQNSCIKNKEVKVEEHHKNLLLSNNKKHISSECNNVKLATRNDKSEENASNTENQKKQKPKVKKPKGLGSKKDLLHLSLKFLGTVRFGNDHIAEILGYEVTPSSYGFVCSNENHKHKWKAAKAIATRASLKTAPSFTVDLKKHHISLLMAEIWISPFFMYSGLFVIPRMIVKTLGNLVQIVTLVSSLDTLLIHVLT
nr:hypothetical protein [Tanacetum cinerariifolium]GEY23173.1 hypothetical protein [Tanacetum cinerariifolium]